MTYRPRLYAVGYDAGLRNFKGIYRHRVDYWQLFDNGGDVPVLMEEGGRS